jgi:ATP-dependent Clp protease ATP-binding subunit ClpA
MQARLSSLIFEEVRNYFRPELLNRFDEQVVFHKLGMKEVRREGGGRSSGADAHK